MPRDEIATATARCAGCLADSVAIGESIDSGEGRSSITWRQHDLLWPLSMSYDASASRGDSAASTGWELMRSAVSHEAPVPGRASRRRRSVRVSHSSFADLEQQFTIRLTTSSRNAGVAGLLKSLESQVTPKLLSPIYSRPVPARSSCAQCRLVPQRRRHHLLEGSIGVAPRSIPPHQRPRLHQAFVEFATRQAPH